MVKATTKQIRIGITKRTATKIVIVLVLLTLVLVGYFIGRVTAPVETVTLTETMNVPTYVTDEQPSNVNVTYYDVPLSHNLQEYIYEICADENVPVSLIMAMIDYESGFDSEAISDTDDYGLMQINQLNHSTLEERYQCSDMLNPYQNVFCGVKIIAQYIEDYEDYDKALMAYNMGEYGARKAWDDGISSTYYSTSILQLMQEYEQVVRENADSIDS